MRWWGKRETLRAGLIAGALATLASADAGHEVSHDGATQTTERGVVLTMQMSPELADNADRISLHVNWTTAAAVDDPALAIFPESAALQWSAFELSKHRPLEGAAGFTSTSGGLLWGAQVYGLEQACPGAGACTLRFRITAQPGKSTEGLSGMLNLRSIATRHGDKSSCSEEPPFPPGAEVTFSFEDIPETAP